jgi:uncharacterized membrane protein YhiD involved in acid resistance
MDVEIYKLLIQWGGGTAVIVAIIFLLKELNQLLKNKTNNNLDARLKKLETNDLHEISNEIKDLRTDVNTLQNDVALIRERLVRIETILKMKNPR